MSIKIGSVKFIMNSIPLYDIAALNKVVTVTTISSLSLSLLI